LPPFRSAFRPAHGLYVFLLMGMTALIRSTGPTTGKVLLAMAQPFEAPIEGIFQPG
jgi:hypothetical protein